MNQKAFSLFDEGSSFDMRFCDRLIMFRYVDV
jgi:hypothetical protein